MSLLLKTQSSTSISDTANGPSAGRAVVSLARTQSLASLTVAVVLKGTSNLSTAAPVQLTFTLSITLVVVVVWLVVVLDDGSMRQKMTLERLSRPQVTWVDEHKKRENRLKF
eukprot:m.6990 g.6990  ORF g.6990 m.6990 type:complete len:112 (+) comp5209_c0_seq1:3072-3407(+)